MTVEDCEILNYLRLFPERFIPVKEIAERAGGKERSNENAHWARAALIRLVAAKILERNEHDQYRLYASVEGDTGKKFDLERFRAECLRRTRAWE